MKIIFALILPFLLCSVSLFAKEPARDVLGIQLSMSREQVLKRLGEIGELVRHERKRQEVWTVRDETFSHVIVGFDQNEMIRYVTAVARADNEARRLPYSAAGDLEAAKQAGDVAIKNFNYQWEIPPRDGGPAMIVMARGRDPEYLDTLTLKRVDSDETEAKKP